MIKIKNTVLHFIKNDFVCAISMVLAIITMFFNPPSLDYIGYLDIKVMSVLFCLMCVVAGFKHCGLMSYMSQKLLSVSLNLRNLTIILMIMCFIVSMFLTNDVALIAFVPLTLATFSNIKQNKLIYIIVILTIAANLGSMLTPIGNPHNLYLFSKYNMSLSEFFLNVAPLCGISFIVLLILCLFVKHETVNSLEAQQTKVNVHSFSVFMAIFIISVLTVLRVIDYRISFLITLIVFLFKYRFLLKTIDYGLLVTFCSFFILVGNLGSFEFTRNFLSSIMVGNELIVSILASQVISNVPASIMLSGFTDNWIAVLVGVNIGGLGTLVASLASLISFKLYIKSENSKPFLYIVLFSILNFALLILLYFTYTLLLLK